MNKRIIGRIQINVSESVPFSELIFLVASGKNYPLAISEARGKKDSSPTAKQLNQLEKRNYLKSHIEQPLNKRIYSINWHKINHEFIDYIMSISKDPDFEIPKKYANNKYLSYYFERIFSEYKEIKAKTIKDIFDMTANGLLESVSPITNKDKPQELADFQKFLELINPSNWESENFINKSERILYEMILNKKMTDKEYEKYQKDNDKEIDRIFNNKNKKGIYHSNPHIKKKGHYI